MVSSQDSHLGGPRFKSRPRN